jgi:hypothetical protein
LPVRLARAIFVFDIPPQVYCDSGFAAGGAGVAVTPGWRFNRLLN